LTNTGLASKYRHLPAGGEFLRRYGALKSASIQRSSNAAADSRLSVTGDKIAGLFCRVVLCRIEAPARVISGGAISFCADEKSAGKNEHAAAFKEGAVEQGRLDADDQSIDPETPLAGEGAQ
jgi:hypothetical protein